MLDLSEFERQVLRTKLSSLQPYITQENLKPTDQDPEQVIAEIEKVCEFFLENTRILISRPDQFSGYRSVVMFGLDFNNGLRLSLDKGSCFTLATVSSDGRLNGNIFFSVIDNTTLPSSLEDAMKLDNTISRLSLGDATKHPETNQNEWNIKDISDINLFGVYFRMNRWFIHMKNYIAHYISPLKSVSQNRIIEILRKQIQDDFNQARLALCNTLDHDVLKTMRGTGLSSIGEGRWLTGGDGVSPEIVLARKQAVRAYPILAGQFVTPCSDILRKAIDNRTSLSDAISNYFNLDESGQKYKVKRLQGLTRQRAGVHSEDMNILDRDFLNRERLREIVNLPDGFVPITRQQFRKLEVFREFGHSVFDENLDQFMERLSEDGNSWSIVDRMEQTSGRNAADAVDFLARKLYIPSLLNKIKMIADRQGITLIQSLTEDRENDLYDLMLTVVKDFILQNFKTRELLDWSDRYHRNIARYEDRLVTIRIDQDWSGISGTLKFGNGHVARELTSSKALKTQGLVEDHCVGGYLPTVIRGDNNPSKEVTLIFSIEKNDKILSTAEIGCIRKPCHSIDPETGRKTGTFQIKARVNENLARSNRDPSRDAVRIANQVARRLEQVAPDAWQAYLDGLEYSRAEQDRISGIDVQIRNCGFDPFDRAMMERVWSELRSALPRQLRKNGFDGFINKIPVDAGLAVIFGIDRNNFFDPYMFDDDGRKIVQEYSGKPMSREDFNP